MTVYFKDIDTTKSIDLGPFGKSGMDVSPMDIPLKDDIITDDCSHTWKVLYRKHYWTGPTHHMTLFLKRL